MKLPTKNLHTVAAIFVGLSFIVESVQAQNLQSITPVSIGANLQQSLPPLDVFVYMDNSETVYALSRGSSQTPATRLIQMLDTMFQQPLTRFGKKTFISQGDRVFLNTFDNKTQIFSPPITVKSPLSWAAQFQNLRSGSHRQFKILKDNNGKSYRDPTSPLFKTNLSRLFQSISENITIKANDGRQKIILIASDFIHDPTNTTKDVCRERNRIATGKAPSSAVPISNFASKIKALASVTNKTIYLGFLDVSDERAARKKLGQNNSLYNQCVADLIAKRPVANQLQALIAQNTITGDVLRFQADQRDVKGFASKLLEQIVTATAPPSSIQSAELTLGTQPETISFEVWNGGLSSLTVTGIDFYLSDVLNVEPDLYEPLKVPITISSKNKQSFTIKTPAQISKKAQDNVNLFVVLRDSSPLAKKSANKFPLTINDNSSFTVTEAEINDDYTQLKLVYSLSQGKPKTAQQLIFSDAKGGLIDSIILPQQPSISIGETESLSIPLKDKLLGKLLSFNTHVALKSTNGVSEAIEIKRPPSKGLPSITGVKWIETSTSSGKWKLEIEINNPEKHQRLPLNAKLLVTSKTFNLLHQCQLNPRFIEAGSSTSKHECETLGSLSPQEGIGRALFADDENYVQLDNNGDERLDPNISYQVVKTPTSSTLTVIIEKDSEGRVSTGIVQRRINKSSTPKAATDILTTVLQITVRNPGTFDNQVTAVKIRSSNGELTFDRQLQNADMFIKSGEIHSVYLQYNYKESLSQLVPRGESFSVKVANLRGEYSDEQAVQNPSPLPLVTIKDTTRPSWSKTETKLNLLLHNQDRFNQFNPEFEISTSLDGDNAIRGIKPVNSVNLEGGAQQPVTLDLSNLNFQGLFLDDKQDLFVCVSQSEPATQTPGCTEQTRLQVKQPSRTRISIHPDPNKNKPEKFIYEQYLYLEFENKDPYPLEVYQLRLKDPVSGLELSSPLDSPFIVPKNGKLQKQISLQNKGAWRAFNPYRTQLAANDLPLSPEHSFDPLQVKIKGEWTQRKIENDENDRAQYIVRVDLEITNRALPSTSANQTIDVQLRHRGETIGVPTKQEISINAGSRNISSTVYFKTSDWHSNDSSLLTVIARTTEGKKELARGTVSKVHFDWYYLGWAWFSFLALLSFVYLMSIEIRRFSYLKTLTITSTQVSNWIPKIQSTWKVLSLIDPRSWFIISLPTGALWWLIPDPTTSPHDESLTDAGLIVLLPMLVVFAAVMTFIGQQWAKQDARIIGGLCNSNENRRPLAKMRPTRNRGKRLKHFLYAGITAIILQHLLFSPINSTSYTWARDLFSQNSNNDENVSDNPAKSNISKTGKTQ